MKKPLFSWPTIVGLVVLFAATSLPVLTSTPPPKTRESAKYLVMGHLSLLYFIQAETMAKKLFPDPTALWSHDGIDHGSLCGLLGNGIWYASGNAMITTNDLPASVSWEACFYPDHPDALCIRVGGIRHGDFAAVLKASGYSEPGKGADTSGK